MNGNIEELQTWQLANITSLVSKALLRSTIFKTILRLDKGTVRKIRLCALTIFFQGIRSEYGLKLVMFERIEGNTAAVVYDL